MVEHAKVTDTIEWGTIEHLVQRQIPQLLLQLTEKASDLDEQDGDEVWVSGEFLADVANALDAAQEQLRAIRPYLREAVSVEAVAQHGRESLWDTLPDQAKQRHLEAARDVIAAAGFTPVHFSTMRESVDHRILVGGNHLTSALMQIGDPLQIRDYDDALHTHGQPFADMWACWRAIMDVRDGVPDNRRRGSDV